MKILPTESLLKGTWSFQSGKIVADPVCERIGQLVGSHLQQISRDSSGWDALYRDPSDGRLWELIYPQTEAHGGGPPCLRLIGKDEARDKYGPPAGLGQQRGQV
jgi:hypothetical protein